jgi:glucose-6-phosphate isomerase
MASEADALTFDFSRVFSGAVGEHGLPEEALDELAPRAAEAARALQSRRGRGMTGWMDLPFETEAVESCRRVWGRLGRDVDDLVVLGIGGSALGTTCLATALLPPLHNHLPREARGGAPRLWVLDNIDPDWFAAHMGFIDPARALFNVITKSGSTAETMSQFLYARKTLADALGDEAKRRVVCTTDPEKGNLRPIAEREGFATLAVPPGAGGRFSVLSAVGLFPAVATWMDVDGLLAGARAMDERCRGESVRENPALLQAAILFLAAGAGINIHVMMPYSQALRDYADWYRQLLAESLGKRLDLEGRTVNVGLTPVGALGVTDQHSQSQLYTEGPYDKLITILAVERFAEEVPLPALYPDVEGVSYLGGRSLAELMEAERRGTEVALEEAGRPFGVVRAPRVDAHAVGQLICFAELAVAYAGELFGVNAFDQPGVEAAKRAACGLMGRKGYEAERERIEGRPAPDARYVL